MPRLSIIIPCLAGVEPLEATLASVLQNRPEDCEIVVLHDGGYDDPYDLAAEVRFVATVEEVSPAEMVAVGCQVARGDVLHLLQSGAEVEEGWSEPAVARFEDSSVAAVAPVVLDANDRDRVVSAGIAYGPGGGRWIRCRGAAASRRGTGNCVLGPTLGAAFYRRQALTIVGGIDPSVGLEMADVEIALSLRARGYKAVLEPASRVYCPGATPPDENAYLQGQGAERVFWRHASEVGWLKSLVLHPALVAGEFVAGLGRGGAVTRLLGRVAVCLDGGDAPSEEPVPPPPAPVATSRPVRASIRIDAAHERRTPRPAPQPAPRRERAA